MNEPDYIAPGSPPIKPLALALRVDSFDAAHVHVSVFAGPDDGRRAHVGHLAFTTSEWEAINDRNLADMGMPSVIMLAFDVLKPIQTLLILRGDDQNHEDDIGAEIREREIGR